MRVNHGSIAAAVFGLAMCVYAQQPPQGGQGQRPQQRRPAGGFVPGQQRPPEDPAQVERGKTLYGVSCRGCHGADLRGGDMGGPNLLRSQLSLSDTKGENIIPIIEGSRQSTGMPAIRMSNADAMAVSAYVRSVLATIGRQGMPPSIGREAPSVLAGNASEGKAYFATKCASCHSVTGDLKGIATKIPDPKALQNSWVAGARRTGRFGGPAASSNITATITTPSGERVEGRLIRIDDFFVSVTTADGSSRSFRREGDVPKVEIRDPLQAHRDLLAVYTDKNMHDVTAYLVTVK